MGSYQCSRTMSWISIYSRDFRKHTHIICDPPNLACFAFINQHPPINNLHLINTYKFLLLPTFHHINHPFLPHRLPLSFLLTTKDANSYICKSINPCFMKVNSSLLTPNNVCNLRHFFPWQMGFEQIHYLLFCHKLR